MSTSFDFVIIGGGNAGLAIAGRLVENPKVTVCVLEFGKDFSSNEDPKIPGNYMINLGKEFDGGLLSTPQVNSANRVIYNPRGKGLGGSSLLNWLQVIRAPAAEYDEFESTLKAKGWNSAEFNKYFKKSQNLPMEQPKFKTDYGLKPDPSLYGDGPIVNTFPRFMPAINDYYYKACAALGVPFNPVGGNGNNSGVWPALSAIDPQTSNRVSSTAYLEPNRNKPNLKIITQAQAIKILFEASSSLQVATGVVYIQEGEEHPLECTVMATKEVILCAGAYRTPQVLELSGIGHSAHVLKGEQVVDLPGVGNNLQEHASCLFLCETKPSIQSYDILMNPNPDLVELAKHKEEYQKHKTGIFSAVPLSFSYVPLKAFASAEKIVKIKAMVGSAEKTTSITSPSSIKALQNLIDDEDSYQLEFVMVPHHVRSLPNGEFDSAKKYFFLSIIITHPFSRGSVHLGASNPTGNPTIDLGLFENEIDLEIMVEGLKFIKKLIAQPSLRDDAGARAVAPSADITSDEGIKDYARRVCSTSFHPVGTASMLPREEGGVVDSNLMVYGTANLRVADASIIPVHISAHPMATVYAIAEKAADIIKAKWNLEK